MTSLLPEMTAAPRTFRRIAKQLSATVVPRTGQRIRMRIGNLSAMDHHPIHLHGHEFEVTAEDGARVPPRLRQRRVRA